MDNGEGLLGFVGVRVDTEDSNSEPGTGFPHIK